MKLLRVLAAFSFVAGLGLLVVGFMRSGESSAGSLPAAPTEFVSTPTPSPASTLEPTATIPGQPTPTPTPLPFDGPVSRLLIPRFGVDSAIELIGLLPNNQLDVPRDPNNTGWYDIYDRPGYRGNAVFSAHVDYFPDIRGPFFNLSRIDPGDEIVVRMEDGTEYRYRVIKKKRYEAATIPMGDLIWPTDKPSDQEWITLITCGGRFDGAPNQPGEYLDRDVVVAERIK
ncbi:MAG: class F sortase [Dehalococcoidia bacterium]